MIRHERFDNIRVCVGDVLTHETPGDFEQVRANFQRFGALDDRVSPSGFVIIDDYLDWCGCRAAVDEFRAEHNIRAAMTPVDRNAVLSASSAARYRR